MGVESTFMGLKQPHLISKLKPLVKFSYPEVRTVFGFLINLRFEISIKQGHLNLGLSESPYGCQGQFLVVAFFKIILLISVGSRVCNLIDMAPASVGSKSTVDWEEINTHVPLYMKQAPWYAKSEEPDNLKHQRKQKESLQSNINLCYDRGAKTFQADQYRKGACENCEAMSHNANSCMERPRKRRAILTNMRIAADEKIEKIVMIQQSMPVMSVRDMKLITKMV